VTFDRFNPGAAVKRPVGTYPPPWRCRWNAVLASDDAELINSDFSAVRSLLRLVKINEPADVV
jgi:hypothetical protein